MLVLDGNSNREPNYSNKSAKGLVQSHYDDAISNTFFAIKSIFLSMDDGRL